MIIDLVPLRVLEVPAVLVVPYVPVRLFSAVQASWVLFEGSAPNLVPGQVDGERLPYHRGGRRLLPGPGSTTPARTPGVPSISTTGSPARRSPSPRCRRSTPSSAAASIPASAPTAGPSPSRAAPPVSSPGISTASTSTSSCSPARHSGRLKGNRCFVISDDERLALTLCIEALFFSA